MVWSFGKKEMITEYAEVRRDAADGGGRPRIRWFDGVDENLRCCNLKLGRELWGKRNK